MRRTYPPLVSITVAVVLACLGAMGDPAEEAHSLDEERAENSIALLAKLLCSGVFVIGRDADEFIRNDLAGGREGMPSWEEIDVSIDYEGKRVTLSMDGVAPRTAVFNGDQGATLLPRGMDKVAFTPVAVPRHLPDPVATPWPMGDRLSVDPLPAEVDERALEGALEFAFDEGAQRIPQKTRAMVVVYKGRIIAERYAPGFVKDTRHICWSMGKSITSALVGILVGEGHFDVEDRAPISEWQGPDDPRGALTLSHLLHMSSGLRFHTGSPSDGLVYTHGDNHRFVYFGAPNVFDYSIRNELEFEPDTVWRYRNCDPLSLGKIIRETVEGKGEEYLTFPQRALFDKIGMANMVLEPDPYGNFIMTGFDYGTARDWARFGLLHLQDGEWLGERILPEGWVDFVRSPAPANKAKAYGGLFWLNAGKRYKSLPEDMYWPAGHHGQVVKIIPSRDLVIVRLGHSALGGFDTYIEGVVARILAAIEET